MADTSSASSITGRRFDMKTDLLLALLPSVIIILVLVLVKAFSKQGVLFSSLASSAFLIYLDPKHPANSIRTLIIAQVSAATIGYLVYLAAGPGYLSAAISMVISIFVMILAKKQCTHPLYQLHWCLHFNTAR